MNELQPHQQRVMDEKNELAERLQKLQVFVGCEVGEDGHFTDHRGDVAPEGAELDRQLVAAFERVLSDFGVPVAENVERIYRLETADFVPQAFLEEQVARRDRDIVGRKGCADASIFVKIVISPHERVDPGGFAIPNRLPGFVDVSQIGKCPSSSCCEHGAHQQVHALRVVAIVGIEDADQRS